MSFNYPMETDFYSFIIWICFFALLILASLIFCWCLRKKRRRKRAFENAFVHAVDFSLSYSPPRRYEPPKKHLSEARRYGWNEAPVPLRNITDDYRAIAQRNIRRVQEPCVHYTCKEERLILNSYSVVDDRENTRFRHETRVDLRAKTLKDATVYDLDDRSPEDCRAIAEENRKLRGKCKQLKLDYLRRHDYESAQFYDNETARCDNMCKKANQAAARKFLERNSHGKPANWIDLHNLLVDEAVEAVRDKLSIFGNENDPNPQLQRNRFREIKIITGRGLHSQDGKARIKPAIESFLMQNGYKFEEELKRNGDRNPGCLVVKMDITISS